VDCVPCERDELRAYWAGDHVLVVARGTLPESCWEARLERSPIQIWPPEFNLTRCRTSDVCLDVLTPYALSETFSMGTNPESITVHHAAGAEQVRVEPVPTAAASDSEALPADADQKEIRMMATSLKSFQEAAELAFRKIASDGPEGLAAANIVRQWVSRGGFVGVNQYHVEVVQLPTRRGRD
jgi:hypothetical protein